MVNGIGATQAAAVTMLRSKCTGEIVGGVVQFPDSGSRGYMITNAPLNPSQSCITVE